MSGTTAADWARRADGTALALRVEELDRRAFADAPAERDALSALGTAGATELRRWREERLARLRREEPGVAEILQPPGSFTCGTIVATIIIATAFALFFSRGNLGIELEVVLSAALLVLGTAVVAAMMPWTPRRVVGGGHVAMAWLFAALGGAAAVATARQSELADGLGWTGTVAGVAALLLAAVAVTVTARRLRVPADTRAAEAERADAVRVEFGERVALLRREAMEQAEPLLRSVAPEATRRAEAELTAAYEVLRDRRLVAPDVRPHRPGVLLVDAPIGRAARSSRMPDDGRLVPALPPGP